jgi:excinuclease ABC subunit A
MDDFQPEFSCPDCGISIDEIEPRSFSFNNPFGACPECAGLGYKMEFAEDLMIPDPSLSINEGAIAVPGWQSANKREALPTRFWSLLRRIRIFSGYAFRGLSEGNSRYSDHGTDGNEVKVHYTGRMGVGRL